MIKKCVTELESKNLRLQSKLDHMGKFCKIFIKSIKKENCGLQEIVKSQQHEVKTVFARCSIEFSSLLESKVKQVRM